MRIPTPIAPADPTGPVPARMRNGNVRAALDAGIHPATRLPLLPLPTTADPNTPAATCGGCTLARVKTLIRTDQATGQPRTTDVLKCARSAPRRSRRQGVDLRPYFPACVIFRDAGDPTQSTDPAHPDWWCTGCGASGHGVRNDHDNACHCPDGDPAQALSQ